MGCAGGEQAKEPAVPAEASQPEAYTLKIGMVSDAGGINDNPFNELTWEGLQRAENELGIQTQYTESKSDANYLPNLNRLPGMGTTFLGESALRWKMRFQKWRRPYPMRNLVLWFLTLAEIFLKT